MSDSEGSEQNKALITEFCDLTGVDARTARECLQACGWNYDIAISSYYDNDEMDKVTDITEMTGAAEINPKPEAQKGTSSSGSRIATYSSLKQTEDSDEEEGQAFYAGGSDRSGQQILGPSKRKAANEIVQEMFKAVRTFGAQEVDPSKKGTTKLKPFKGAGYVLGSSAPCPGEVAEGPPEPLEISLRLWQSGFTIDDGPLREYSDPQNKAFLDTVRRGEIPMELHHQAKGGEIDLKLEDHSHDEYIPQKPKVKAFSGSGMRLGNVTPVMKSAASVETEADAQKSLNIDNSKPTTNLQIRLADGSRLTMQANHNHTVGDVRRYIVEARPEYATVLFSLMTSFPPTEITEDSATLEEANLLNAVIVQKIKK